MSEAKTLSSSCLVLSLLSLHWASLQLGQAFPSTSDYLQRGWQRLLEEGEGCVECRPEECPAPRGCLAGTVRDACDCCWECANLEGQICDLDNTNHFYGKCGEHLECRLDAGDLRHGEVPEPQCACLSHLALCGSDGKTYAQICRFLEVARAHPDANLTVDHEGPCESEPQITSPPYDTWNITGQDVIFGCEVFAYPMASIEWRKDGMEMLLPGDDPHISVQFRGGPQKYEVTGWLQIQGVRVTDEGTYRCFARNRVGEVVALASLTVFTPAGRRRRSSGRLASPIPIHLPALQPHVTVCGGGLGRLFGTSPGRMLEPLLPCQESSGWLFITRE
ncbi:kazal-type serine protease inhibitor domain-containing protein 1 isoform X2 [Aquila chrysaetos chrysaetos]|uniref:kazal-type serine protease inhibitor domain-containing protein 1 isoform X2 n=1 Tax=Aquila chrysaetos chrysaetos TaxID=223781 RepID=UPI001176CA5F|nr:kazal-type serine protease inhibitor domain-containing protein 1 isoform X2 [Aquila chrysaetos chrysaetos]